MVDGQILPEYKVEYEDDGNTARCWVPSEFGKEFSIHWYDTARVCETAGYVYVDGEHVGGRFIRPVDRDGHVFLESRPLDANTTASFKFGTVVLTDEENEVEAATVVQELGMIKVVIKEGAIGESYQHEYKQVSQKPVNERMKKAGGHRVVLGKQQSAPQTWKQFYPFKTQPTTFIFQYKPLDLLRAMDIASEQNLARAGPAAIQATRANRIKKEEKRASSFKSTDEDEDDEWDVKEELDDHASLAGARTTSIRERRKRPTADVDAGSSKRGTKRKIEVIDLTFSDDDSDSGSGSGNASGSGSGSGSSRPAKRPKVEPEERKFVPLKSSKKSFAKGEVIDLTL